MINDLSAGAKPFSPEELAQTRGQGGGEFSKGMRSGALGLGAGFSNAAGAIGGSLGFPEFSKGAYATADDLGQQAAAAAPRITSFRDIGAPGGQGRLRDTGDFLAGTLGGIVPSAALGIGAGLAAPVVGLTGLGGALAAGTAAYTLPETGDVVGRMRDLGQPVETGKALALGLGSAAGQSIVPGLVAGKIAGKALRTGPMGMRQVAGTTAQGAGLEAASEGGSEAFKQAGLGQPLDLGQIADNAVAGAVGGAGMGGIGGVAEYAHSRTGDVSKGLDSAKNAATGLLAGAKGKLEGAKTAASDAKEKLSGYDFFDKLGDQWDEGTTKAKDTLQKIADGELALDPQAVATATKDKLQSVLAGDDGKRTEAVKTYVDDLMQDNLTPEQQATVQEWMANPGDHAKQAAVAGIKLARDKGRELKAGLKGLADRITGEADDQLAAKGKRVKKSEDFSAADAAIFREIAPLLQEAHPEMFTNSEKNQDARIDAARVIRGLVKELSAGKHPSSDIVAELIDLLGPKAADMIEAGYRAVGDKAASAKFFEGLNAIDEAKKGRSDIVGALRGQLKPQFQKIISDRELGLEADTLEKWATESRKKPDDPEFTYRDRQQRAALATRYENPEAVLAAVEARLPQPKENQIERARPEVDEEGNVLGEKGGHGLDREVELSGQKLQLHTAKGGTMYERSGYAVPSKFHQSAVEQRKAKVNESGKATARELGMDELGADHPTVQATRKLLIQRGEDMLKRTKALTKDDPIGYLQLPPADKMKFESGFERDVYDAVRNKGQDGVDVAAMAEDALQHHVVLSTEVSDSPQSVSPDEVREMALDTHQYGKSKSRLDTGEGGPILDGMRVQRFMQARFKDEYTAGDEKSRIVRMGRMFIEGVAAVQEHLGRSFDVPDSVVIGRLGSKDITFGEARSFDVRTEADKASDDATQKLTKLRAAFREVSGLDPKTGERVRPKPATAEEFKTEKLEQDKLREAAREPANRLAFAKMRDLTGEDNWQPDDAMDFQSETRQGISDLDKVRRREMEARLVLAQTEMEREAKGEKMDPARAGWVQLLQEGLNYLTPDAEQNLGAGVGYAIRNLRKKVADFEQRIIEAPNPNSRAKLRAHVDAMEKWLAKMEAEDVASMKSDAGGSGQREIDPFGQVHQAAGFNERRDPEPFKQAGGAEAGMGEVQAPSLLGTKREAPKAEAPAPKDILTAKPKLDGMLADEDYKRLTTASEVDRFLQMAKKRYSELKAEDAKRRADDLRLPAVQRKALATLENMFGPQATVDLNSFYDGVEGESMMRPTNRNDGEGDDTDTDQNPGRAGPELREAVRRFAQEGKPSPKAVAAKKAAFLEKARSGDAKLLKTLASSNDAAGLQRAVAALKGEKGVQPVIDTINARLSELVRADPSVGYGLSTKRYSLEGLHVSNTRHDGVFDWRKNLRTGQGESKVGAGTYLMPAENTGAHENFRGLMESRMTPKQFEATGFEKGKPATYHVTLNAEPHQIMLWDERFSKQPKEVQDALLKAARDLGISEKQIKGIIEEDVPAHEIYGYDLYNRVFDMGKVSDALDKAGIVGAKYRSARGPEYVVYRDSLITTNKVSFSAQQTTPEWVYHGTRASDEALVQPDGSLLLKPSKNFGSKTHGVSFTDDLDSATDYATRIKGGGPQGFRFTGAKIIKIKSAALTNIEPEAMREWADYSGKEIVVPKGQYSIEPAKKTRHYLRDSHLQAEFDTYIKENYSEMEREQVYEDSEFAQREYLSEIAHNPDLYEARDVEEAKAILRDQFGEGKKFSRVHAESYTSGVDEIEVFGKVWDLGGGKAVEATRAEFFGPAPLKGKVYFEGFTEDGDQVGGWAGSLAEARAKMDGAGVATKDPVRAKKSGGFQESMLSRQQTTPGAAGAVNRKAIYDYIQRVLGPNIRLAWKNIMHAGEFERTVDAQGVTEDVIRLSIHSLNPLSTAHHEALHAFFERLRDMKHGPIMDVLEKAGSSASVMNQLKRLLANEPAALKQLENAEERAAYMYQFWASGQLNIGPATQNVFQKIAQFVREVLGIWSNDQRALHILEYFHSGDFAKDSAKPFARDIVGQKLMAEGRNGAIETAKRMSQPFREMGEALFVAGGQRLRDTGIPSLHELADAMKLHGTNEGEDAGFLPAQRAERTRVMNDLGAKLKGYSQESINAALESLQSGLNDPINALTDVQARLDARKAKVEVDTMLKGMLKYMRDAGVDVNDLGVNGATYFPRVYDISFISSHQTEFKAVLAKHGVTNTDAVVRKLMVSEGAEFTIETDQPGMQHLKLRKLAFIPDSELAPFMRKNLFEVLNGYITQATRRAEWARRFDDKSGRITELLTQAKREGATDAQIKTAQNFVRAVDGTLGDTINPQARRLIGDMLVYQNLRLLPLMIFSSVVDPMGIVVNGGKVSDAFKAFKRGASETVKNFKKNATDDDMTKLAASIGVIDDTALVHTLGALYSQGMVGDTGRKINDTLFRFNLAEQFNTSMRVSAMEAAMGFLARNADGKADKHSVRRLNELGLQVGDVKLDAQGRVDLTDPKIKAAINRWVDGAVLRPDAVDKAIWMSDPHFALISHLKQFIFSFHETIIKRVTHEFEHGNYAPAMALTSYVPIMIAADLVKGMIQGGGEQPEWKANWGLMDYIESGIERAGLLGTGQFAADAFKDVTRGGSGIGALSGPTIEQLTDAIRVLGGNAQFDRFAIKSMPANALYAHALGGEATDPKFVD